MAATQYNFSVEQGTIFGIDFSYRDSTDTIIDLSNHCCIMRIQPEGSSDVITYSTTSQTVTADYYFAITPETGTISLRLPAETTNGFTWESAIYELEIITPDLFYKGSSRVVKRLLYGTITNILRTIPSDTVPSCSVSEEAPDIAGATDLAISSAGISDSCIGSPCEFIGGNATIYNFYNSLTDDGVLYLRDRIENENPYGKSSPFPLSLSVEESKTIERVDVFIEGFSHNSPQDIRLLLTHNGSGVLLLDQSKFNSYDNKPKNLSFVISDYAQTRPDGKPPITNNVLDYNYSLLANKNLGATLPGVQGAHTLNFPLPPNAFDDSDTNGSIPVYSSGLKTFEGMNSFGDWKLYGIDYNEGDNGSILGVKLIVYFQNEQSDDLANSSVCGMFPRYISLVGTSVTIYGDITSELSLGDTVLIEYDNGYGSVATTRTVNSTPSYSTSTGNTTFSIDSAISGTVNDPKIVKYNNIMLTPTPTVTPTVTQTPTVTPSATLP